MAPPRLQLLFLLLAVLLVHVGGMDVLLTAVMYLETAILPIPGLQAMVVIMILLVAVLPPQRLPQPVRGWSILFFLLVLLQTRV